MRTILYAFALLALLAVPVWAKTTTWTFGADPDTAWSTAGNWDNGVAAADDVIDISSEQVPTTIPEDAGTFNFSITNAVTVTLADWLNTGAIGDVTVGGGSIITTGANVTGNAVITDGTLLISNGTTIAGTVSVDGGSSYLTILLGSTAHVTGLITVDNTGGIDIYGTLDANGGITIGSGNGVITNDGTIEGWVNAAGNGITWNATGTITVDQNGTLDLGTDADNDQAVTVTAETVTIGDSFRCKSFTLNTAGTLTGAGETITADTVTWTAGSLDSSGSLNVTMVGTGGLSWSSNVNRLGTITFSGTTTATNDVRCQKVAGDGTIAGGGRTIVVWVADDEFWTLSTTASGWGGVWIAPVDRVAPTENTTLIDVGASPFKHYYRAKVLKLTGGLSCGEVRLDGDLGAHTLDMNGGNLNCTNLKFDEDSGTFLAGEGTHNITGVIGRVAAETGCVFNFETAHVTLSGSATWNGIAVDFGSTRIDVGTDLTFNGTTATSIANSGAIITGRGGVPTFTEMDTNFGATDPPIFYRRGIDDGSNGGKVQPLAPFWTLGMR